MRIISLIILTLFLLACAPEPGTKIGSMIEGSGEVIYSKGSFAVMKIRDGSVACYVAYHEATPQGTAISCLEN